MFKGKHPFIQILLLVFGILSIPLIAMQFTDEVSWKAIDFLIAGLLLYIFGWILYYLWTNLKSTYSKITACIIAIVIFLLLWAELAVGIFGSPLAGH